MWRGLSVVTILCKDYKTAMWTARPSFYTFIAPLSCRFTFDTTSKVILSLNWTKKVLKMVPAG